MRAPIRIPGYIPLIKGFESLWGSADIEIGRNAG